MSFLTLLQSHGSASTGADIGPGDYSSIAKTFPLPGETKAKRKRLTKAVVKQIKAIAVTPPTLEDLKVLVEAAMPDTGKVDAGHIATAMQSQLESVFAQELLDRLARMESEKAAAEEAERIRRKVIIEQIARYMEMLEDDEILLMHLM